MESTAMRVRDAEGQYGVIEDLARLRDRSQPDILVRLDDGQQVRVPKAALGILKGNTYPLDARLADLVGGAGRNLEQAVVVPVTAVEPLVIPVKATVPPLADPGVSPVELVILTVPLLEASAVHVCTSGT